MLSVSELNEKAKALLEATLDYVEVSGEISRLTKHASGHWYFTLKDEKSSISAVMYRMNNQKVKFLPKEGLKVKIYGKVTIYSPSGSYQLVASAMLPDGEGELELAFRQLKEKLENEGLFDIGAKKEIPNLPKKIALVTSATSAALHGVDVIVLARGGGSKEDLWCFNDEGLAREIYATKTPVISAIGHEIDYVISDFVADRRSLTPSAAMLDLLPDEEAFFQYLDRLSDDLDSALNLKITKKQNLLNLLLSKFSSNALKARIELKFSEVANKQNALTNAVQRKILLLSSALGSLEKAYEMRELFFESTKGLIEVRKDGKRADLRDLNLNDEIELISQNTHKKAIIKE